MNTHRHLSARFVFIVSLLLASVLACPTGQACKFWGMIGQPDITGDSALYTSTLDLWYTLSTDPPYSTTSPHGWAALWYHPDAAGAELVDVHRDQDTVTAESFAPYRQVMFTDHSYTAIAHTRRATSGLTVIPDPHPFVYTGPSGLYGKTWSMVHNGTANSPAILEDSLGSGFISLPIFQDPARQYAAWNAGAANRNDSEYYMMLLMKYLMVANSYYCTAPASIGSPTEWAINQAIKKITTSSSYSAMNSMLTDGQELWLMFRKSTPYDNYHFLSYYSDPANPAYKLAMTTLNPLGSPWVNFTNTTHGTNGQYVRLQPNQTPVVESFQATLMANPNELRVNEASQSVLSQQRPAVSANPADASFVVAWETTDGNHIKARWLNPMGLAERGEFLVDATPGALKLQPRLAHNPVDGSLTVVWKEQRDLAYPNLVKARRFVWDLDARNWTGDAEWIVNSVVDGEVENPRIAFDDNGTCLITWVRSSASVHSVWCRSVAADGTVGADQQITPANTNNYTDADASYLGRGRFGVVYAVTASTQNARGVYLTLYESATQALSAPKQVAGMTTATDPAQSTPTISRVNDSVFVASYWLPSASQLVGKTCRHQASLTANLVTQRTDALSSVGPQQPFPQVAARGDGRYYVCYQKLVNGRYAVYCAMNASKRNFGTPELISVTATGDRMFPAVSISRAYTAEYRSHSTTDIFDQRRLVVWQTSDQDGSEWGISGRFHGLSAENKFPWYARDIYNESATAGNADLPPEILPDPIVIPSSLNLSAYPNPFNPVCTISYSLERAGEVNLTVFDLAGRQVAVLAKGGEEAGAHTAQFDGSRLASGIYFARIHAGGVIQTRKLVLLK